MVYILAIALIVLVVFICFWVLLLRSLFSTAPFVPIPKSILAQITNALAIPNGGIVYDLGCGDGRVLRYAAKIQPNAQYIGIEKNAIPFWIAKFRTRKYPQITILKKDFFRTDISEANSVYVYLFPSLMPQIFAKFQKELKPGTIVVSCDFRMHEKEPQEIIRTGRRIGLGGMILIYKW
jgi:SAM-dependent methyltransferase